MDRVDTESQTGSFFFFGSFGILFLSKSLASGYPQEVPLQTNHFSLMSKPTALFIGRFQPFHTGHLLVLQGMTKLCGKIWIGIGSSQHHHEKENPFTAQERKEMIQRALQAEDLIPLYDINFVELPDETDDVVWRKNVLEKTGAVDVVWTGNPATQKCFEGIIPVKPIKEVPGISSTEIRQMIIDGGEWKKKVPEDVAMYISEVDGASRIRPLE